MTRLDDAHVVVNDVRALFTGECLLFRFGDAKLHAVAGSLGTAREYPFELFHEDPLHAFAARHHSGPEVTCITNLVGLETFRASVAYHEFYAPNGAEHCLSSLFDHRLYGSPMMSGVMVSRARRDRPFSDQDHATMTTLLGAFSALSRREDRAQGVTALATLLELRSSSPLILADFGGQILWQSSSASRILQTLQGDDSRLPEAVALALKTLICKRSDALPTASVNQRLRGRTRITFDLQLIQTEASFVCIDIIADAAQTLTGAETRVLQLLEQGLHNRDIAAALGVGIETVRTQTKCIYKKRGVGSRLELLANKRIS